MLDGVDLRDWDLESLRRNFAVVLQDIFLFSGTVESNIRLGREDISDERVKWAAKEVHAQKFIERLAARLSIGGQRTRRRIIGRTKATDLICPRPRLRSCSSDS